MLYSIYKKIIFKCDPEFSHSFTLKALRFLHQIKLLNLFTSKPILLPCKVMDIDFPNPVGLAAGLDKNADYLGALASLGFGFIEVGTVTPKAQIGNPKPRLFRLPQACALINRLGFNNHGLDHLINQIQKANYKGVLGINIGKNAATPLENAIDDYLLGLRGVYPYASYIVVNLSSPNTPDLRELQYGEQREALFTALKQEQNKLAEQYQKYVPLAIKIAPDLTQAQLQEIAHSLLSHHIDGVIATNTTSSREGVEGLQYENETGGLSGKPLFVKSTDVIRQLHGILQAKIPIIGVGGIMSGLEAVEKINAGASLVQIYTGLIYSGIELISEVVNQLKNSRISK